MLILFFWQQNPSIIDGRESAYVLERKLQGGLKKLNLVGIFMKNGVKYTPGICISGNINKVDVDSNKIAFKLRSQL